MASHRVSSYQWKSPFFNEKLCCVILSFVQKRNWETRNRRQVIVVLLQVTSQLRRLGIVQQDDFQLGLAWTFLSEERMCRSMGCIALHNTGVFFCLVLWCFNTPKKRKKDESKKKNQNFIPQADWRARSFCTSTTAVFSGVAKQRLKLGDMF